MPKSDERDEGLWSDELVAPQPRPREVVREPLPAGCWVHSAVLGLQLGERVWLQHRSQPDLEIRATVNFCSGLSPATFRVTPDKPVSRSAYWTIVRRA